MPLRDAGGERELELARAARLAPLLEQAPERRGFGGGAGHVGSHALDVPRVRGAGNYPARNCGAVARSAFSRASTIQQWRPNMTSNATEAAELGFASPRHLPFVIGAAADLLLWIESREQSMSFSEDEYDRIAAGNADVREGRLHDHAETLAEARALYGR